MNIKDDHMYYGAALAQIAEHDLFTSINQHESSGRRSRSAFSVNEKIGVYIKYAKLPVGHDYNFTFTKANKQELDSLNKRYKNVFLAMVCIEQREICCVSFEDLQKWLAKREKSLGRPEETSTILVNLPKGKGFRVSMNMPGSKGVYLDKPQTVPRKKFPDILFEND